MERNESVLRSVERNRLFRKRRQALRVLSGLLLLGWAVFWASVHAAAEASGFETPSSPLSPYFFVQSDDPDLDALPLKSTAVEARIAGIIADVKVVQVYRNEGKRPIEAIYVFPAPTRASVYGMTMTVGSRVITAKVRESTEARRIFEKARDEGRLASLLEQQRPNVYQMQVTNILPGDEIRVELRYVEGMVPTAGEYEFVYPTVVAPRYVGKPSQASGAQPAWAHIPYLSQGRPSRSTFGIQVHLNAGMPVRRVGSPSHKVQTTYHGEGSVTVSLDPTEAQGGNRDFVLRYGLSEEKIQSGILLHKGEKENFFLLMVEPPERIQPDAIPPREYVFLVDVSGSMAGFPLEVSRRLLADLLEGLRPEDRFNVVLFSGASTLLSPSSLPASPENLAKALEILSAQTGGGGTELLPALRQVLALPRVEGTSRTVILVTDGLVTAEREVFQRIREKLGEANVFAFGIGAAVNRHLIEGVARAGMGEAFVVSDPAEARAAADRFRRYVAAPLLTQVKADFGEFQAEAVEPPAIPDLLASRPLWIFGKWRGEPRGTIRIRGMTAKGPYQTEVHVSKASVSAEHGALAYLWARHRIGVLSDMVSDDGDDAVVKEIMGLGLRYNLVTAYTSFVAEDAQVRVVEGKAATVFQPLPLPMGVSGLAVAGGSRGGVRSVALRNQVFVGEQTVPSRSQGASVSETPALHGKRENRVRYLDIEGDLPWEAVRRLLEERAAELQACLEEAERTPSSASQWIFAFTVAVDARGRVSEVSLRQPPSSWEAWSRVASCLSEKVKGWSFPASQDGRPAEVRFEIVFAPAHNSPT